MSPETKENIYWVGRVFGFILSWALLVAMVLGLLAAGSFLLLT